MLRPLLLLPIIFSVCGWSLNSEKTVLYIFILYFPTLWLLILFKSCSLLLLFTHTAVDVSLSLHIRLALNRKHVFVIKIFQRYQRLQRRWRWRQQYKCTKTCRMFWREKNGHKSVCIKSAQNKNEMREEEEKKTQKSKQRKVYNVQGISIYTELYKNCTTE